jgi:hypothetical protein
LSCDTSRVKSLNRCYRVCAAAGSIKIPQDNQMMQLDRIRAIRAFIPAILYPPIAVHVVFQLAEMTFDDPNIYTRHSRSRSHKNFWPTRTFSKCSATKTRRTGRTGQVTEGPSGVSIQTGLRGRNSLLFTRPFKGMPLKWMSGLLPTSLRGSWIFRRPGYLCWIDRIYSTRLCSRTATIHSSRCFVRK